jgi:hypothetical protein
MSVNPSVWSTNILGLISNFDELSQSISITQPCIIMICETHLTEEVPDSAITIPGYSFFDATATGRQAGVELLSTLNLTCP